MTDRLVNYPIMVSPEERDALKRTAKFHRMTSAKLTRIAWAMVAEAIAASHPDSPAKTMATVFLPTTEVLRSILDLTEPRQDDRPTV